MKRCARCKQEKPLSEFYKGSCGDGKGSYCKPCVAEKKREWVVAHPERARELNLARHGYKMAWARANRARCPRCGAELCVGSRNPSNRPDLCATCEREVKHERWLAKAQEVERLWAEGLKIREIAERFDSTPGSMQVTIARLREQGFNLPYRHRHTQYKHPELAA
jgi:hypothetical protein